MNRAWLIGIAMGLAACATGDRVAESDSAAWSLVQPYHHEVAGMGSNAILGSVLVPASNENIVASGALLQALQDRQLSVVRPEIGVQGTIPPRTPWSTDIAPISDAMLRAYNDRFPALTLRGAIYGIAYQGEHDTSGSEFRYKIGAHVYARGTIGSWSPVDDGRYSGKFFVDDLAGAIRSRLQAADSSPR